MKNIKAVFKREFKSYFDSPVAYVFLTAFLVLIGFMTFGVAMFYERRQADLTPFFFWHPWVYLLLVPAATMGLWADERRNGTAELILTLPMTVWDVLVGKFLAAWAFMGVALGLTFPVAITVGYLGSPDWGTVLCGYVGSFLLAGAASAVGVFASTLSRSSVVGFVISLAMVFLLLIVGFDPVTTAVANWGVPSAIVNAVAGCSLLTEKKAAIRVTPAVTVVCGLLAGVCGGLFSIGGPIMAIYYIAATDSRESDLANAQANFAVNNVTSITTRVLSGYYTLDLLPPSPPSRPRRPSRSRPRRARWQVREDVRQEA